jgi:hypothetical protein
LLCAAVCPTKYTVTPAASVAAQANSATLIAAPPWGVIV